VSRKILVIVALGLALSAGANAQQNVAPSEGHGAGNGGDICENRILTIRAHIVQWILKGGSAQLRMPTNVTLSQYNSKMLAVLRDRSVRVSCEKKSQAIGKAGKTCINSGPSKAPWIECDIDKFMSSVITPEAEQYRLVHHEFAGLAGLEENIDHGTESNYSYSDQITGIKPAHASATGRWFSPLEGLRSVSGCTSSNGDIARISSATMPAVVHDYMTMSRAFERGFQLELLDGKRRSVSITKPERPILFLSDNLNNSFDVHNKASSYSSLDGDLTFKASLSTVSPSFPHQFSLQINAYRDGKLIRKFAMSCSETALPCAERSAKNRVVNETSATYDLQTTDGCGGATTETIPQPKSREQMELELYGQTGSDWSPCQGSYVRRDGRVVVYGKKCK
jgi:hypothetical protein